jgi:hypothetical protein
LGYLFSCNQIEFDIVWILVCHLIFSANLWIGSSLSQLFPLLCRCLCSLMQYLFSILLFLKSCPINHYPHKCCGTFLLACSSSLFMCFASYDFLYIVWNKYTIKSTYLALHVWYSLFSTWFLEETVLPSLFILGTFVRVQLTINTRIYV